MSPGTSRSSAAAAVAPVSIAWPIWDTSNSAACDAAVQVLRHHAAAAARRQVAGEVVLHRHGIAGEPDHAGTEAAVPGIQRGGASAAWASGRPAGRSRSRSTPKSGHPVGYDTNAADPPLSRNLRDSGPRGPLLRRCGPRLRASRLSRDPESRRGPCCLSVSGGRLRLRRRQAGRSLPRRVAGTRAPCRKARRRTIGSVGACSRRQEICWRGNLSLSPPVISDHAARPARIAKP